jgi:Hydantoinase/oxoprolinase
MGFIRVANESMCRPIRELTQVKGRDTSRHVLACFGGAGGQHACAIARSLGIKVVLIHRYSGILSAYGMTLADVAHEEQEAFGKVYDTHNFAYIDERLTRYGVRKMVPLKGPTQMDPSLPNLLKEDQFLNSSLSKSLLKSVTSKTKGELVDVNFILKSVEIGSGKFGGKLAASGILRRRTEMNNEVVHSRNIHESVRLVKSKVRPGCSCLHTPTATIYSDTVC